MEERKGFGTNFGFLMATAEPTDAIRNPKLVPKPFLSSIVFSPY